MATTLAAVLPVGRPVIVTNEVLDAARVGDVTLLVAMLAPEAQPQRDEVDALRELDADPERGETLSVDQVRAALHSK